MPINPGFISATVNDSKGAALVGANVGATPIGGGSTTSGLTNSSGKVTISVMPGQYSVTASKSGYSTPPSQVTTVVSDVTNDLTFVLTAIP